MRYLRLALLLALVAAPLTAHADSQPTGTISLSVLRAEAAPLPAGPPYSNLAPPRQEVFVYVVAQFSGETTSNGGGDALHLAVGSFRLRDSNGVMRSPIPYVGPNPLLTTDLSYSARTGGWLLFTLPLTDTANLQVCYVQSHQGYIPLQLPCTTPPFTPHLSLARAYATAAQPALDTYLADEALAAGYIVLNVDAQDSSTALPLSRADRAYLAHVRSTLVHDHAAFDRVTPDGKDAASWKMRADRAFSAIEDDLSRVASLREAAQWPAWRATFGHDDGGLATLYQNWPGAQPVPLWALTSP